LRNGRGNYGETQDQMSSLIRFSRDKRSGSTFGSRNGRTSRGSTSPARSRLLSNTGSSPTIETKRLNSIPIRYHNRQLIAVEIERDYGFGLPTPPLSLPDSAIVIARLRYCHCPTRSSNPGTRPEIPPLFQR
jgi:hypothetical protein